MCATAVNAKSAGPFEAVLAEIRSEAATTRRVLDRIPEDKLDWRPHPKSMSLGQLGMHIAIVPGAVSKLLSEPEGNLNPDNFKNNPQPKNKAEILSTFDEGTKASEMFIGQLTPAGAAEAWTLKANGAPIFAQPRATVIRSILMNQIYHHRGQLSVYLRLLEVPVPSIYGPSADENPFAPKPA